MSNQKLEIMKQLTLFETFDLLANAQGNNSIRVHLLCTPELQFYVTLPGEGEEDLPEKAILVAAGRPDQFFVWLKNLIAKDYLNRTEFTGVKAHKISVEEAMENAGIENLTELVMDSTVPACCSEECMVEPDGTCEHGYNSVLLELNVI